MAKYKVKSLHISGLGKKQHHSGETVTDKDFTEGRAADLCEQGHLELIGKEKADSSEPTKAELKVTLGELEGIEEVEVKRVGKLSNAKITEYIEAYEPPKSGEGK